MTMEAAAKFLSQVTDPDLVARAAAAADPAMVISAAGAAAGHDFTPDEFRTLAPMVGRELSDAELGGVAGGIPNVGPVGRVAQALVPNIGPVGIQLAQVVIQ